LRYFSIHPF